jgi:metal-dependent amidase/aminoacylase/carboxypeptidase family protein
VRDTLHGTIKFIFQPAEEDGTGATAMIEDGVLENPAPEAIFALHCTNLKTGQILCVEGPVAPGIDLINITLSGNGNPNSNEKTVKRCIREINNTGIRDKSSGGYFSVRVANVEYDPSENQWNLECALFETGDKMFAAAKATIKELLARTASDSMVVEKIEIIRGVPLMINDVNLMSSTYGISKPMLGENNVIIRDEILLTQSGEDFGLYQQIIPGAYIFLGVSNKKKGIDGTVHTPQFSVDEEAIFIGIDLMKAVLLDYVNKSF